MSSWCGQAKLHQFSVSCTVQCVFWIRNWNMEGHKSTAIKSSLCGFLWPIAEPVLMMASVHPSVKFVYALQWSSVSAVPIFTKPGHAQRCSEPLCTCFIEMRQKYADIVHSDSLNLSSKVSAFAASIFTNQKISNTFLWTFRLVSYIQIWLKMYKIRTQLNLRC
jgi:hypothetical protein